MKKTEKSELEVKIDKASKIGINALQVIVGACMIFSTSVFSDFKPFQYYKPIVEVAGLSLLFYGAHKRDKKFKYLSKTCKELYEKTKETGDYEKANRHKNTQE